MSRILRKILWSPITRGVILISGFIAAVSVVRAHSAAYNYYIARYIGQGLLMPPAVAWFLFLFSTVLFLFSVRKSKSGKTQSAWHKIDASLLAILLFCAVLLCVDYVRNAHTEFNRMMVYLFLLSAATYAFGMAFLAEITRRVRDKRLRDTLYWPAFFRLYPPTKPIGLLMALLLAGNLFILLVYAPLHMTGRLSNMVTVISGDSLWGEVPETSFGAPLLLLAAFTLADLTYCCSFILSLSAQYEQANAEKIRSERFKAELITNVSHDIRTPLTSIINYVDLLKALPVENNEFVEYTAILEKKSARLKTLISDLLEASKAGAGSLRVDIQEIDLEEIVGQIAGDFSAPFTERGLTLVLREPDQPVTARADSGHLRRVLENVFDNAAKYALPGTRVFADISLQNGAPAFRLRNTSENAIDLTGEELAEQFIRGDRSRQSEGSGLGLYIAKSLVELTGGSFSVRVNGDLVEVELSLPL